MRKKYPYREVNFILYALKYFITSNDKIAILGSIFSFILIVIFSGTSDYESIILYLEKLQSLSVHRLDKIQKTKVTYFYINNQNRHPSKNERYRIRKKFNFQRKYLKQEWENKYKITWPTTITTKNGSSYTLNFEAHHIVPINAGGINTWWNISPLSTQNHKLLHNSIEEKACFSHDFLHQKIMRFLLRLQLIFSKYLKPYINKYSNLDFRGTFYFSR